MQPIQKPSADVGVHVAALCKAAKAATRQLATADTATKNMALRAAAWALRAASPDLIAANAADIASLDASKPASFIDRLRLDEGRVAALADALDAIADEAILRVGRARGRPVPETDEQLDFIREFAAGLGRP